MRSCHIRVCLYVFALFLTGCTTSKSPIIGQNIQNKQKEQQCFQMFSALKTLDNKTFKLYQHQFSVINENYEIYKKNQSLIDGNSAEIMRIELNNKVDVVCARVRSAMFSSMSKRANELNKL